MKTRRLFVIVLAYLSISLSILAQAPDKLNYQAVLRDANGNVKANASVSIVVSILQGSATGTAVYTETHASTSNNLGLINLQIGAGTATLGTFASIDWAVGPYYLKISVDGTDFGTSQLVSVPYAKYAEKAGNGFSGSYGDLTGKPSLAAVATSGSYTDLSNKPTLFDGTWGNLTDKPTLASVATSASYTDLINKPDFTKWDKDSTDNVILTGNQTIAGTKTFSGTVRADSLSLTKKTTKWVFDSHSFVSASTDCSVDINSVSSVSFVASATGDKIIYLYLNSLPYQVLGNVQKIKSITIRYQCVSAQAYITSLEFVKVTTGLVPIISSTDDLTSTSAVNYTNTLPTSVAFDEATLYLKCVLTFNGTSAANAIKIFKVLVTTE